MPTFEIVSKEKAVFRKEKKNRYRSNLLYHPEFFLFLFLLVLFEEFYQH